MKAQKGYTVYPINELRAYCKENGGKLTGQIKYNLAFLNTFSDREEIAVIASSSKYGILFHDQQTYDSIVNSRKFPVGLETDSFFEKDKALIEHIEDNIGVYVKQFYDLICFSEDHNQSFADNLDRLDTLVTQRINTGDFTKHDGYLLGFVMAYYLKQYYPEKLYWHLLPEYTLNIYWVPVLKLKSEEINRIFSFWKRIWERNANKIKIKLPELLKWQIAQAENVPLLSKRFGNILKDSTRLPDPPNW